MVEEIRARRSGLSVVEEGLIDSFTASLDQNTLVKQITSSAEAKAAVPFLKMVSAAVVSRLIVAAIFILVFNKRPKEFLP